MDAHLDIQYQSGKAGKTRNLVPHTTLTTPTKPIPQRSQPLQHHKGIIDYLCIYKYAMSIHPSPQASSLPPGWLVGWRRSPPLNQPCCTLASNLTLSTNTLTISAYRLALPIFAFSASILRVSMSRNSTSSSCVFSFSAGCMVSNVPRHGGSGGRAGAPKGVWRWRELG